MKNIILFVFSLVFSVSSISGGGGFGGGTVVNNDTFVTEQVCYGGETGSECRTITYKIRPPSPAEPARCTILQGEAGEIPCPQNSEVPNWLKKFNSLFK